jgi:hypothetical protein
MKYATGSKVFLVSWIFGIISIFRLFFSIQVVQVPEELIKAMSRGQEFIKIAQGSWL